MQTFSVRDCGAEAARAHARTTELSIVQNPVCYVYETPQTRHAQFAVSIDRSVEGRPTGWLTGRAVKRRSDIRKRNPRDIAAPAMFPGTDGIRVCARVYDEFPRRDLVGHNAIVVALCAKCAIAEYASRNPGKVKSAALPLRRARPKLQVPFASVNLIARRSLFSVFRT